MEILTKDTDSNHSYSIRGQFKFILIDEKTFVIWDRYMEKTGVEMSKDDLKLLLKDLTEILNIME